MIQFEEQSKGQNNQFNVCLCVSFCLYVFMYVRKLMCVEAGGQHQTSNSGNLYLFYYYEAKSLLEVVTY